MKVNKPPQFGAQVDVLDEQAIILHIRALLDLHNLLLNGYETEFFNFTHKLLAVGWNKNRINEFVQVAAAGSRYNYLISSDSWKCVGMSHSRRKF